MRSKHAFCYNSTHSCIIYAIILIAMTGSSTLTSIHDKHNTIELTTIKTNFQNASINTVFTNSGAITTKTAIITETSKTSKTAKTTKPEITTKTAITTKTRAKRSIVQLAGMIRCVSGCDPFSFKGYGCYCGLMGSGKPVDLIDRCCLEHDWCYTYAACPQMLVYFLPYQWSCVTPGYARCGVVPFGGITEKCSYELCQCDIVFAKCLSRTSCPIEKPICQSSPIIAIQNIIIG